MSLQVNNPILQAGCSLTSGPNTGEFLQVRGGIRRACVWSGTILTNAALGGIPGGVSSGGHAQLWSGAGRLNSFFFHQGGSGIPFFYDANAIAPSGVSVSGQTIIGVLQPSYSPNSNSGIQFQLLRSEPDRPEAPFFSGLCVSIPSGVAGFTCTFTPEYDPTNPNVA